MSLTAFLLLSRNCKFQQEAVVSTEKSECQNSIKQVCEHESVAATQQTKIPVEAHDMPRKWQECIKTELL